MESEADGAVELATPLDHALDQLVTARDHLVKLVEDGALTGLDHAQLVGVLQSFERSGTGCRCWITGW